MVSDYDTRELQWALLARRDQPDQHLLSRSAVIILLGAAAGVVVMRKISLTDMATNDPNLLIFLLITRTALAPNAFIMENLRFFTVIVIFHLLAHSSMKCTAHKEWVQYIIKWIDDCEYVNQWYAYRSFGGNNDNTWHTEILMPKLFKLNHIVMLFVSMIANRGALDNIGIPMMEYDTQF